MSSILKWIGGCVLLTLPFSAALFVGSVEDANVSKAPAMSFSQFETRISEIATGVQRRFAARVHPQQVDSSLRASDPRHLSVRDAFLAEHFEAQNGGYICQLKSGESFVLCEIRGLQLKGPFPLPVTDSENALGISTKLYYDYKAKSFRVLRNDKSWGEWTTGIPPSLGRLELFHQSGDWFASPTQTASIPGRLTH
ncbi:MAG: hypothetical protein P1U58_09860 [Verrucomicrobiales bacterium]|nr:hypothetical protein [Verrucomicrobiales bacterium]